MKLLKTLLLLIIIISAGTLLTACGDGKGTNPVGKYYSSADTGDNQYIQTVS